MECDCVKEIKTTTTYTEDRIKRFLKFYYFDKIKVMRIILNILIIIVIINFFTSKTKTMLNIISFIFALIGLLELNTSFLPWFNYFKLKRKKDNLIDNELSYVFKKNDFKLSVNKDEYIDYNNLIRVVETDDDYYLYITKSKSLIVGKDNLSSEEINTLTNIFKEKVSTYIYKKNV